MRGVDVTVKRPVEGELDSMGEPSVMWESEIVSNVLVAPAESERIEQDGRARGTDDIANVYFPKSYTARLKGCKVTLRGEDWDVIGDPQGYMADISPTAWNRRVSVRKVEG
jgi:hypothetical protein